MSDGHLSNLVYPETALKDGKFVFPDSVKIVRIDVGLSTHASHSAWFLDLHKDRGSIGIEADPRCYDELIHGSELLPEVKRLVIDGQLIRHNGVNVATLGSRFILVRCAISDVRRYASLPFYLTDAQLAGENRQYKVFGTSSLHVPSESHPSGGYRVADVPAIPLSEIIAAVPDRFEFIEEIKVDTEGHDFNVLVSAGESIRKAVYVTVESGRTAPKHHHGIDVDSTNSTRSLIERHMENMGFRVDFEDSTDQRYINIRLEKLVRRYGLDTEGDPLILGKKSSRWKRIRFKGKRFLRGIGRA
ncbi:MAG: FkbM family methyltransferase [Deltaproteobacteria bacterium]|nr:FkbM family methyltransferase [Deltaproteobacteria bacterium]